MALAPLAYSLSRAGYAVCTRPLPEQTSTTGEIHLFPDGAFRAHDGRPHDAAHWRMDAGIADQVTTKFDQRARPLVVDYEHQTLYTEQNGQPAPAAGWIDRLEFRVGLGLVGLTRWTAQARDWIASDPPAYRFASPVFTYDPRTGAVLELLHAALTNDPAVDRLRGVVAGAALRFSLPEVALMDPELLQLLGLPTDADAAAVRAAVAALKQHLAAQPPLEAVNELRQQVAALQAERGREERAALIDAACRDGRLLGEKLIAWAQAETTPLAALRAYLDAATPVAALAGRQTQSAAADSDRRKTGELTDEQKRVCARLNVPETEYWKALRGDA